MHPYIYSAFEALVSDLKPQGRILEIGAVPSDESLLAMPGLQGRQKVGVNLQPPGRHRDFEVLQANGNDLSSLFETGSFDCVLSNATLEHDRYFWKTCQEIRRVLRPGGLAILGAPGFSNAGNAVDLGIPNPWPNDPLRTTETATLTFVVHNFPGDYWRFSEQAVREVFFEGYTDVAVGSLMVPPRIIGFGFRA